jgi:hypothetical protein
MLASNTSQYVSLYQLFNQTRPFKAVKGQIMKWVVKKQTVDTDCLPLKKLNIMEGDNIVARLVDKDENSKHNANLIASAPEMIEMLKVCVLQLPDETAEEVSNLIAKAEGR